MLAVAILVAAASEAADKKKQNTYQNNHTDLLEGYFLDSRRAAPVMKRLVCMYKTLIAMESEHDYGGVRTWLRWDKDTTTIMPKSTLPAA